MKNFQNEYKISVNRSYVPDELVNSTKATIFNKHVNKNHPMSLRLLLVSGAAILLICASALAYEQLYRPINHSSGSNHIFANGQVSNEQNIDKTTTSGNIKINTKSITADSKNLYMTIEVSTIDGSALMPSTETSIAGIKGSFAKENIIVENASYHFNYCSRTDDCSIPSTATFELQYVPSTTTGSKEASASVDASVFKDQDLQLELNDFQYEVNNITNINFKYANMEELYNTITPSSSSAFSTIGIYTQSADGTCIDSYSINPGNNHIIFSDNYPDSYIDNIGIHSYGDYPGDALYISIVPGNDLDMAKLKNLRLLDTETGNLVNYSIPSIYDPSTYHAATYASNDGRLILAFFDPYHYDIASNLSRYKLVMFDSNKTLTVSGTWKVDFRIANMSDTYVYTPSETVTIADDLNVALESISISNSFIEMKGTTISTKVGDSSRKAPNLKLTLQDGTVLTVRGGWSGGYSGKNNGDFDLSSTFSSLINAENVVGIEIYGQYISLKE